MHYLFYQAYSWFCYSDLNVTRAKLTVEGFSSIAQRASVVLDLADEGQGGMSLRTFEALTKACKLLTDNDRTLLEFKDDQNVASLDLFSKPGELHNFITEEFKYQKRYERYQIKEFIQTLIG